MGRVHLTLQDTDVFYININHDYSNNIMELNMTYNEIAPIIERLDNIQKKLDGSFSNKFLSINQVSALVSLSPSTIRRAVARGELKCSRRLGKLLFQESAVRKWLNG